MSPTGGQCHWNMTKQTDGSTTTQISVRLLVKNLTAAPLGLVNVRLMRPKIPGEVVCEDVSIRSVRGNLYGSAVHSGHMIPPKQALPATIMLIIRGTPKQQASEVLHVTLGVTDDEGNEQRIKVPLRGFASPPKQAASAVPVEAAFEIKDPIAKEVVSVLQSEIGRYDKCGRQAGGLGSVHIVYKGSALLGVGGGDAWNLNSPKNQSIVDDPVAARLESDNLEALITFYGRLSAEDERRRFLTALMDRLGEDKGYLRVSYFIVCALWKAGHLDKALAQARERLPRGDNKVFGLSNVLLMLNGLLRYRHADFTSEMLDDVESFVHGLEDHTFQIGEKIASIRARRLLAVQPAEAQTIR